MGKTAFSGPVFGAKSLLMSFSGAISSGASTLAFVKTVVPANEDWFVTEAATWLSTNSSNAQIIYKSKVAGVGATMLTVSAGASTVGVNVINTIGALGGSSGPLGYYCPANSTIRFTSTSINPIGWANCLLHGWRQWVNIGNLDVAANFNASTRSYGN